MSNNSCERSVEFKHTRNPGMKKIATQIRERMTFYDTYSAKNTYKRYSKHAST